MNVSRRCEIVETQAFKAWFGASVAVDASGGPLILYHGTETDFGAFRTSPTGIFFTEHPDTASAYAFGEDDDGESCPDGAQVLPVFLQLLNPMRVNRAFLRQLVAEPGLRQAMLNTGLDPDRWEDGAEDSVPVCRELLASEARSRGHDGIVFDADLLPVVSLAGDWSLQRSFAVFGAGQIKSAIGNCGRFDPDSTSLIA